MTSSASNEPYAWLAKSVRNRGEQVGAGVRRHPQLLEAVLEHREAGNLAHRCANLEVPRPPSIWLSTDTTSAAPCLMISRW